MSGLVSHDAVERLREVGGQVLHRFQPDVDAEGGAAEIAGASRAGQVAGGGDGERFEAAPGGADPEQGQPYVEEKPQYPPQNAAPSGNPKQSVVRPTSPQPGYPPEGRPAPEKKPEALFC